MIIQLSRSLITGDLAPVSTAISSSVSGSSPRASRQSKENIASGPNRPSMSWSSRGADADVHPRLRDQLAAQSPWPEHVDAGAVQGLEAVLQQVGQLVAVQHHPVGDLLSL